MNYRKGLSGLFAGKVLLLAATAVLVTAFWIASPLTISAQGMDQGADQDSGYQCHQKEFHNPYSLLPTTYFFLPTPYFQLSHTSTFCMRRSVLMRCSLPSS